MGYTQLRRPITTPQARATRTAFCAKTYRPTLRYVRVSPHATVPREFNRRVLYIAAEKHIIILRIWDNDNRLRNTAIRQTHSP